MSQTERQEEKVAENASNKRKWGSNHNGSLSQQNKGHKALELVRRLHAMNVGIKGTKGEIVQSKRTKTMKQIKSTKARGVVHAFGGGETEQDLNNIEDEIEA
nr:hypothetical protein [Tanacetum cinerariifolium]